MGISTIRFLSHPIGVKMRLRYPWIQCSPVPSGYSIVQCSTVECVLHTTQRRRVKGRRRRRRRWWGRGGLRRQLLYVGWVDRPRARILSPGLLPRTQPQHKHSKLTGYIPGSGTYGRGIANPPPRRSSSIQLQSTSHTVRTVAWTPGPVPAAVTV